MNRIYFVLILLVISLIFSFSHNGICGNRDHISSIKINDNFLKVEIVSSKEKRALGLQGRDSLPKKQGMLFVFEKQAQVSFWMKDTTIPLSIAFIDESGLIRKIQDMDPLSLKRHSSQFPVKYALEVNQGWFDENGIEVGNKVEFNK